MNGTVNLSYWVAGSLALHLGLVACYQLTPPPPNPTVAIAPATRLSLGMAAALAGASAQQAAQPLAAVPAPAAVTPPAPTAKPKAKPVAKPIAKPTVKPAAKPAVKPAAKPIAKPVAKPIVKPVTKLKPKPVAKKSPAQPQPHHNVKKANARLPEAHSAPKQTAKPTPAASAEQAKATAQPAKAASKAGQQGTQGSRASAHKKPETGHAEQTGGQAHSDQFDAAVRRHLLSRKQTPTTLSRRQQGTVDVEFVIDRQGRLVRQGIGAPSGVREFDRAARVLVASAAPYPIPPADLTWQERRYKIAIHYQSR
ncbi:MAG: TonB family protein [Aeromonas sp.]